MIIMTDLNTGKKINNDLPAGKKQKNKKERCKMLYWAVVFLVVAIVAAILGFGGIVSVAVGISKILFFIFLVLFVITLLTGLVKGKKTKK